MRHKSGARRSGSEKLIRTIKCKTRRQYSTEEKIRIVLDGLRDEDSIAGDLLSKSTRIDAKPVQTRQTGFGEVHISITQLILPLANFFAAYTAFTYLV